MVDPAGKLLRLDANAISASSRLPAFLDRPDNTPVYHGFPLVEQSRTDGWVFGTITEFEDENDCEYGDAFVVAPDGTRAGLVWAVGDFAPREICAPSEGRWGVYGFASRAPIRTTDDFVAMCREFLPELKRRHAAIKGEA